MALTGCGNSTENAATMDSEFSQFSHEALETDREQTPPFNRQSAIFGAGCFWCVEAVFQALEGVHEVESGYMGGHLENPDYQAICSGQSGHAEVVRVHFDPDLIKYSELLEWFWKSHDPTTLNRQGADQGTQYRSAVFFIDESQRQAAEISKERAQDGFKNLIVTEITEAAVFYPAEDYHQNYYQRNGVAPYCRMVIAPKLRQLGLD